MSVLHLNRRAMLRGALAAAAAAPFVTWSRRARAEAASGKLLFVVAASGGASITDAFLPVTTADAGAALGRAYAPDEVEHVRGFDVVKPLSPLLQGAAPVGTGYALRTFVERHGDDMVVLTQENTSVNHAVAAHRALTGAGVFGGRTIAEAAAAVHGADLLLPNVTAAAGGYGKAGTDRTLPSAFRGEVVAEPLLFALGTHGSRGVRPASPTSGQVDAMRTLRTRLEGRSPFVRTFGRRGRLAAYLARRDDTTTAMEAQNLAQNLLIVPDPEGALGAFGLPASPETARLDMVFPDRARDGMHAQASLAFALARFGVSSAVTISTAPGLNADDSLKETPDGFDYAHSEHRVAQNAMWGRTMETVDKLISLLKSTPHLGDPALGMMWDRSLIYVATEFGRDRLALGGSGHHLNNGTVLISPMLRGGRVYGGVDADTGLTYGFDPRSGAAAPGTVMREESVYATIAAALGIRVPGGHGLPCVLREAP